MGIWRDFPSTNRNGLAFILCEYNATLRDKTVIPRFAILEVQISKKIAPLRSLIKVGETNLGNKLYTTGGANPSVGSMYYVSITFDQMFN